MTFGAEIAEFVAEMITEEGGFGSLLRWRHYTRTRDDETFDIETTIEAEVAFTGAIAQPVHFKDFFSEANLVQASSVVVVPIGQLTIEPKKLDQVEVTPGQWLKVIDIREYRGPGETGSPVLAGYMAALSS